jgi:hypothetical protein
MAVRLSALRTSRALLTRNIFLLLVPISFRGLVRPEGNVNWKKIHSPHRVSNPRPSGLWHSAYTTTLSRAPLNIILYLNVIPVSHSTYPLSCVISLLLRIFLSCFVYVLRPAMLPTCPCTHYSVPQYLVCQPNFINGYLVSAVHITLSAVSFLADSLRTPTHI